MPPVYHVFQICKMALVCSISNEVPEEPVLSPVSNHVFEKRLIVKFIQQTGNDPINGEPLSEDQLLDIKVDPMVKARPPSATSIPAILKLLQDEWDACMLHTFTLRQQLQTARQELSHALYQHDAACRVIARLTKEVTAAREALATLKPQAAGLAPQAAEQAVADMNRVAPETMETEPASGEMTEEILQKLQDTAGLLTSERKKRGKKPPEGLTTAEEISNFNQLATHPGLHSASTPGILALDLSGDTSRALTGGADKMAVVFDKESEQIVASLKGHSKKVTNVIYHPSESVGITSSPDTTIRVWNIDSSSSINVLRVHEGPVTGISLHATGDYLLSSSTDQYWAFTDIRSGRLVSKANDPDSAALTCAQFHPDGLIFGTGTADSVVKIWDLRQKSNAANFPGHSGQITTISFSENGYYLASAAEDSVVKLWDLRKLKNFKTLELDQGYQVQSVCFDQTGTYLAVGGTDIQIYLCKQWNLLKTFTNHSAAVTGVRFGRNASFVASVSMDRSLKYFGN